MAKYRDSTGNVIMVDNPNLNQDLIAGKTQVDENTPLGSINSQTLSQQPAYNFSSPNPSPIFNVAGLGSDLAPTDQEQKASTISDSLQSLNAQLMGQSDYRAQQEQAQGIPELAKTQNELSSRLATLKNEALAIPLQLQQDATGRGITAGGLRPIETAALRNNAIQALSTSSLLEASRGNLALAQDMADRAVAQRFDPIKEQIAVAQANLDLILKDPRTSLQDKNRAMKQQEIQSAKAAQAAAQEAEAKEIWSITNLAGKYGADVATLKAVSEAPNKEEALLAASQFLQDPKARMELESVRLDNILKRQQFDKTNMEIAAIGKPTPAETKALKEAKDNALAAIPVLESKKALIDSIINSPGFSRAVGPNQFARGTNLSAVDEFFTASGQNFIAGVEQLRGKEFIDAVLTMKAQGGTLGALNQQEGDQLRAAASKIQGWAITEGGVPGGKIIGYNTTESAFKEELETIKEKTQLAITRARGSVFDDAEVSTLDEVYRGDTVLSPNLYYK